MKFGNFEQPKKENPTNTEPVQAEVLEHNEKSFYSEEGELIEDTMYLEDLDENFTPERVNDFLAQFGTSRDSIEK